MKVGDLVMTRDQTSSGYTNLWWRVMFIDNDGTFVGELERFDRMVDIDYEKGEHVTIECDDITQTYEEGMQFCYGDNITICDCPALCRNK